mmetsp:Transcript_22523/g.25638  ORF Transcript_22523/g.25638 Transcript_22523/m.25638 type:complete len:478 (+) Transcript_22523:129-1562(+)
MSSAKQINFRQQLLIFLFLTIVWDCCDGFQSVTTQTHQQTSLGYKRLSHLPSDGYNSKFSTKFVRPSTTRISASESSSSSEQPERPEWALDWMPTWLITLRPIYQVGVALCLYVLHLKVLTQKAIVFPFQLIPNRLGHFQSLGLDSLMGILSIVGYMSLRRATKNKAHPAVPSLFSSRTTAWNFPKINPLSRKAGPRSTAAIALFLLVKGYFMVGRVSMFWENFLYTLAGWGFKMTVPMHRSISVLLGHMSWIGIGSTILSLVPRPQPFFGGGFVSDDEDNNMFSSSTDNDDDTSSSDEVVKSDNNTMKGKKRLQKYRWFTSQWNTYWLWWVLGGYFVSAWVFNLADFCNQMILPHAIFEEASQGVVEQLLNPENNDLLAGFMGCLAPCFTAPWWEEILYRGFMLPALCLFLPHYLAIILSGIVFSIHHVSATGAIPLMILGCTWASIYTKCGNLMVTILVHAMWNSRVFLGNWLGL